MSKNLFIWLKNKYNLFAKHKLISSLVLFFILLIVIAPSISQASVLGDIGQAIANAFLTIVGWIVELLGWVINMVMVLLTNLVSFNNFTNNEVVKEGWVLIRDICNMFFIIILLVISVGTVLGIESYSYKGLLKKVIYMAILINFSKTIAGFLIDVSQIIMLSFINSIQHLLAVGFIDVFGLNDLSKLVTTTDPENAKESADVVAAFFVGIVTIIFTVVVLLVLISICWMLVVRIVTLWILVILSPFAYLLSALPGKAASYSGQWWSKFSEQLIVGPAIAFFLWLTLTLVANTQGSGNMLSNDIVVDGNFGLGGKYGAAFVMRFIIAIGMLMTGLKLSQAMGGDTGAAMDKAFSKVKGMGGKGISTVGGWAKSGGKALAVGAGGAAALGLMNKFNKGDKAWNKREDGGLRSIIGSAVSDRIKKREGDRKKFINEKILGKIGLGGEGATAALAARYNIRRDKTTAKAGVSAGQKAGEAYDATDANGLRLRNTEIEKEAKKRAYQSWNSMSKDEQDMVDKNTFINDETTRFKDDDTVMDTARQNYIKEQSDSAVDKSRKAFKPRFYDLPMQVAGAAASKNEDREYYAGVGRKLIDDPSAFRSDMVLDSIGSIHGGRAKTIMKQFQSTDQVEAIFTDIEKQLENPDLKPDKRKSLEKNLEAAYKLVKFNSDEGNVIAKQVMGSRGTSMVKVGKDMVTASSIKVDKSKKDFMYDQDSTYDEQSRLKAKGYSTDGITTGNLKSGGNTAAVNFEQLQNMVGSGLEGEKRAAGMHLTGDFATKAAEGMRKMLEAQMDALGKAMSSVDITSALQHFGINAGSGADLGKLKEKVMKDAQSAYDNLGNTDKISSEGLILLNKARTGRTDVREPIRHERAHESLDQLDPDETMQKQVWNSMSVGDRQQATEYIRKERNVPDMSEDEARKEWFADAYANQYRPGGPEAGKPVLSQQFNNVVAAQNNNNDAALHMVTAAIEKLAGKDSTLVANIQNTLKNENKINVTQQGGGAAGGSNFAASADWYNKLKSIKKAVSDEIKKIGDNDSGDLGAKLKSMMKTLDKMEQKSDRSEQPVRREGFTEPPSFNV